MDAVPKDVTVKKYFEEIVAQSFGDQIKNQPIQGMEGTEFSIQFVVTGSGGATYAIVVKDGKEFKVVPGGIASPLLKVELSENDWRDSVTGQVEGAMDQFMKPERASKKYFDVLKGMRGTLNLALAKVDGGTFASKITFNGSEMPSTTIKMKVADYAAMNRGEIKGPAAFMAGKMKIEGDMGFAMKLGQFMGA